MDKEKVLMIVVRLQIILTHGFAVVVSVSRRG